ncbi:hypothetical protein L207DRAFT_534535 [Hyaloscypha variabilis F]|uniref:Uncharacterized protein n=1 Tax=Hyaloscypha variabilis (strain UAMH 11265 / GT02V1 / F) TaxID=1149755 RepID=A0A2J6R6R7_HYAVF|nr:hypothetical protein L207DRAFT_534535 [Hyaloscypha variabilis F]
MRNDGTIARILWKTAKVLEADAKSFHVQEANNLKKRAAIARVKLLTSGEDVREYHQKYGEGGKGHEKLYYGQNFGAEDMIAKFGDEKFKNYLAGYSLEITFPPPGIQ